MKADFFLPKREQERRFLIRSLCREHGVEDCSAQYIQDGLSHRQVLRRLVREGTFKMEKLSDADLAAALTR